MQRNTNKLTFDASPKGKVKVMMIEEWDIPALDPSWRFPCVREVTTKSALAAQAVTSDSSVAKRSYAYQTTSLIDMDAMVLCFAT